MDNGHGDPAPLPLSLAFAFSDTPSYLTHFSLHYYRDEIPRAPSGALPWISKSLRLGDPPLPVLARCAFEAPIATWMSSKCHSVYLEQLEALDSGHVTVAALLPGLRDYRPPSISAEGFPELCAAVFEAYVQTCDALDLCARLREMLADGTGTGSDDDEGVRCALEDHELQVSARAARVQTWLALLGPVAHAIQGVDPSTLSSWSSGWHAVLDELQLRVAAYMTASHAMLLIPAMCKACLEPLQRLSAAPTSSKAAPRGQALEHLAGCVGRVVDRMVSILPERYHGSMATLHGVHHNAMAVLSVMRFESRLAVFLKLEDCIEGLRPILEEFEDVLGGHSDFLRTNRLLDPERVDLVAAHLQETDVRLHDAEIRAMKVVESHVESLESFKRGVFVSSLVGGSKAMTDALVRRGLTRLDRVVRNRRGCFRRVKGMPVLSASVVRNRHLASLASAIVAFHRSEETEAAASALLCELRNENTKLATSVERACATAMDTAASDVLRASASFDHSPKLTSPSLALSEVWMSGTDTSVHWVLTRLRRLQAIVQSSDAHLAFVEKEIPAAAASFRGELAALSTIGLSATITSACLDGYLDKHRGVLERVASLREVLERNIDRFDSFCVSIEERLDSFDIASPGGLKTSSSSIPIDAPLAALVEHVGGVVLRFMSDRDSVINDSVAELVDVGDAAYRCRLEARASHALAAGVAGVVGRVAGELFSRDVGPTAQTHRSEFGHDAGSDSVRSVVVLAVPTVEEAAPTACRLLAGVATEINKLVSDAVHGLTPVDTSSIEALGKFTVEFGSQREIRVSEWLVVEVQNVDQAETPRLGTPPHTPLSVKSTVSSLPVGLDARIESAVQEAGLLKDAIMGHLRSTKEELAPLVSTIVSDMQERAWLLDAAVDRLRYDFDVYKCLEGDEGESFDDSVLPEKGAHDGLIRSLRSKVLKTEQALLADVRDMEARARDIQSDLEWMKGVQSYSVIDLEMKLRELGVTLDHCVDRAHVGSSLTRRLAEFSALFGGLDSALALDSLVSTGSISTTLRDLNGNMESFSDGIERFKATSWEECRRDVADLLRMASEHQSRVQDISKSAASWSMFHEYRSHVFHSTEVLELVNALCSAPLEDRHWDKLDRLCAPISTSATHLTSDTEGRISRCAPADLWALVTKDAAGAAGASEKAEVEDLIALAVREGKLRAAFEAIKKQWNSAEIELGTYKSKGAIFLESSSTADVMDALEDAIMSLGSMASNRASQYFRSDVKDFLKLLSNIEESMQLWLSTQSVWSYMEAVFDGGDIAAQLPEEAARFSDIDSRYLAIVREVGHVPRFAEFFRGDDKREAFVALLGELETCQKSLSAYLESKRKIFPRFYFVSDSTLLEILSHGSNPRAVQRHFQAGLFDGVDRLTFEAESNVATHIVSKEGETVELRTPVAATGPAETWLAELVESMRETMRWEARRAAKEVHRTPIEDFVWSRPAQMALLGLQVKWTADVQSALYQASLGKKGSLKRLLGEYETTLSKLVELTLSNDISLVQRTSLETCITIFIHQKDVIEELLEKHVGDPRSFDWLKHCRFRWREDKGSLYVSICDNEFEYGYEYLGVKERLVMTPLTDVCYVALTQAVGMNCGGAPAGPAGTGKTETTKDLGATLGRYVVVFNCSDQMDHHMMGRIFKGLAQAGFWGCFDEFNRINLDVLSVCAQQLNCVFMALKERKKSVVFSDGDSIPLNPEVGYFITMNPGYAGRQELPENLKALFRGVTMMAPDRRIIMKVKLAAAGFQDSDVISRKFDRLYTLCEQQLSKQPHYDFGLRNILSVLRTAGAAKRANPRTTEMVLMMKTLHDMNVSKFVAQDVQTFSALMRDVFPRVEEAPPSASEFSAALKETCEEFGWIYHAAWADKCLQLYESSIVRHGIMVVGPSRSGKTTAIDAVARTLTRLGSKTSVWKMNPKSITAPQMFGRLDPSTGDWTDGIFSQLWKKAARTSHSIWIVVDGPVDAVWIENLNTVLDDNKVLTLANGDRVRMMPSMRLIFEAENLNNASPATVSRAGVVYMSSTTLGWRPIAESYVRSNEFPGIRSWLSELVEACLEALASIASAPSTGGGDSFSSRSIPVEISEVAMMEGLIAYLDGLVARHPPLTAALRRDSESKDAPDATEPHVKHVIMFCAAWGFGGSLPRASRVLFSMRLKERFGDQLAFVPDHGSIHDLFYDVDAETWVPWVDMSHGEAVAAGQSSGSSDGSSASGQSPTLMPSSAFDFSSITVRTPEETRCRYLMDLLLRAGKIPHLVGPLGTGKTTIVRHFCEQRLAAAGIHSRTFAFSALTSPQMFYNSLKSCLEKRQGCNYGPVGGGSMIFVIDDISLPQRNEWGDQVTNELLRQLLELDGFYRLTKPIGEFKNVGDVNYVATSKLGSDLGIPNRLSGIMQTIYVDRPTEADVALIVERMVHAFSTTPGMTGVVALLHRLGKLAIQTCYTIARTLPATTGSDPRSSDRFHYTFGMHKTCTIVRSFLSKLDVDDLPEGDEGIIRLFVHECRRELVDMLVSHGDARSACATIDASIEATFGFVPTPSFFSSFVDGAAAASGEDRAAVSSAAPAYRETVGAGAQLVEQVEAAISKSRQREIGSLVFFDDALHHVLKVTRVLESDRRSVMLVGVGGSGKKSIAKVAAAVAGVSFLHSAKGPNYGVSNFLDDLGAGFKRSGIKGESVCFLMSDADVCDGVFLDFVNQQLSTGRVSDLFQKEDVDSIVSELRPAFKEGNPGAADAEDAILEFFWDRVARYFHFCFCFSPSDGALARWSRQFPGLLSACTIDWFHPWPTDALRSLAARFLPGSGDDVADLVGRIHAMMMRLSSEYFEETGRQVHITPKSYLSFVGSISTLHSAKLAALRETRDSLSLGLEKMAAAKDQVDKMKVELEEKQVVLDSSKLEIATLIAEIDESTAEATVERRNVQSIVSRVTKKAKEIFQTKLEAERDLEAAKPALDAALEALNSITPKDITSLKALRNPPDVIKRIMDCVLILRHMRVGKTSWQEVKGLMVLEASYPEALKMMNDMGFLQKLLTFPKEEINDETVELLKPYFRADDFNYESAKKASGNVAGLCNWAEAMCKYHVVAREVEPKIIRLKESEKELNKAKMEQQSAEEEKDKVERALQALERKLEEANGDMDRVKKDADTTEMKLNNAITLIESLGGEGARWQELKRDIDDKERDLLGDCLLACTFTSYLGPIGVSHRESYLKATKKLCNELCVRTSESFDPVGLLADGADVLRWLEASLPADEFSVQNGALFASSFQTTRIPYVIDPQGQCTQWIQKMYRNAVSVPISSTSFMETLESAIARGVPIIVQNVDSNFGTSLDCILDRALSSDGTVDRYVKIGDRELEAAPGFQAILTTRLANPSISPENFAKCTVIDFTVTGDGLEEQFLGFLISRDEADLDRKRQDLDEDVRRCEAKMKQLENDLLMRLSSHQGDILEDTHLIGVLADTKETTRRVAAQLREASVTKRTIAETCEKYRHCARVASLLYFALCDFARQSHMYETSLEQFLAWLDESIRAAAKASTIAGRAANVLSALKRTVYMSAQYGMFEKDKDAWRLLMAAVCSDAGRTRGVDLGGAADCDILRSIIMMGKQPVKHKRKAVQWLSDEQWMNVLHLQQSGLFDNLLGGHQGLNGGSESKWKAWVNSEEPESTAPPIGATAAAGAPRASGPTGAPDSRADPKPTLHQMALVRALRPNRSRSAARVYVEQLLGSEFVASRAADLSKLVLSAGPNDPIICVISPGADPTSRIHELARKFKTRCLDVSMGQGQEVVARECLALARDRGDWVCIQNAHLAGNFLKELADDLSRTNVDARARNAELESATGAKAGAPCNDTQPGFRLWITTEPTSEFPLVLLHRGIRITCEPPSGVHDALLAIVANLADDTLEEVKTPFWKPMLLSLICMHVLSQERKRFGAIGWVVGYEFSAMDLLSSLTIVSNHLFNCQRKAKAAGNGNQGVVDKTAVDWEALRYLISAIQYGGRIIDDRDQRLMDVIVKRFVSPELCSGGVIHLLDPKRFAKLHHMYRLRVDDGSTRESLVAEVDALPADIPELFGLDGAAERVALELAGRAMLASLETVMMCRGSEGDEGERSGSDRNAEQMDETIDASDKDNADLARVDVDGAAAIDVQMLSSEPLRAVFRMELSQKPSRRQMALLRSSIPFKGRCLHLGAMSNPKALLNAVLQDFARRHTPLTIDELEIEWSVTKLAPGVSVREPPKEGIYLWGIALEGGVVWDEQRGALKLFVGSASSSPARSSASSAGASSGMRSALPVMHVSAVEKGKRKKTSGKRTYSCPLYVDESRKAAVFVDFVELAIDGGLSSDEFVQRGVAMIVE